MNAIISQTSGEDIDWSNLPEYTPPSTETTTGGSGGGNTGGGIGGSAGTASENEKEIDTPKGIVYERI